MTKLKNNGLTPSQIKKAVYGQNTSQTKPTSSRQSVIKTNRPVQVRRPMQHQELSLLLNMPYSTPQMATKMPTPDWFTSTKKVDISVIVPLYNSSIDEFVEFWDFNNNGIRVEIIFVDDNCPTNSKDKIVSAWSKRRDEIKSPIGSIYHSCVTQGWGACCNIGAEVANASILAFISPDAKLFPHSLMRMVALLRTPNVGVVGGLHVNEKEDNVIESGKEWNWSSNKFLNIGSETYRGKPLARPFQMNNTPDDIFQSGEREMVSSSLMMVDKNNFREWGGFCPNLYSQEWSDADFCMNVREHGFKVMYQSQARLYRLQTKTDRYAEHGKTYFSNKWITSGRIDKIVDAARTEKPVNVENILLRRSSAHGDVLIAAAVAPALKKKYPNSKILFSTECPEVVKNNPWIDRIVEEQSERQFQLFFNLDMVYEYRPDTNILTAYAEAVGVDPNDCRAFLHSDSIDVPDDYVVIHSGKTLWAGRNWTSLKFDQVSNRLRELGKKIVCVGTNSDNKTFSCDLDLRGSTTIGQLAHVIKHASLFIGIDSFPMHVAQVYDIPGVAFFGSITPSTRLISKNMTAVVADGVKCLGCHHRKSLPCPATTVCEVGVQECINGVSVDRMWKAINAKLNC